MKKLVILSLLLGSLQANAGDNVWDYLHALTATTNQLQIQTDDLKVEVDQLKENKHKIGDLYNGGIVFWVDSTGEHGLIASKTDVNQTQGIQWRNGASGNRITNARGDGIGAGEGNTRLIISQQTNDSQPGTFAALLAFTYKVLEDGQTPCPTPVPASLTCYGGWYLPSAHELSLIKINLSQQGFASFAPDFYWSSTEVGSTKAWMQNFGTGEQIASDKASTLGQVRAVSRF